MSCSHTSWSGAYPLGKYWLKQQELDDLALSLAVRNNWSPERIVEAKERVTLKKKTALEVAFDKAKGRGSRKNERPR
jgi:hypothetical protein